ncbi:protein CASP [Trichomonascus vanleenenianus]|uniref:CCAAT displacement transcription factor COY1 n=1 Tax=Trichomonascus vanleenenianus TaxID=2268995 RepID=UPI003ECA74AE
MNHDGMAEQSETPFEAAIKAWSEVNISALQKSLDDEGLKMIEHQKSSVGSRKELATRTKAFKKLPDEDKLSEIKSLLKLYQGEIDSLTNRSKFAETSFLNVYKALSEAPDPKPLLEASVDSVLSASEVSRLSEENARLTEQVSRYADYDNVKAKLLKVEQQSIENAQAKVKAKESEMKALMDEKERSWRLREEEMTKQIEELRAAHEVKEAQMSQNTKEEDNDGRIAELELVARDLERANGRVWEMEKRNLELRAEVEAAKSGAREADARQELEKKISDLEGENVILAARIEAARTGSEQNAAESTKRIASLEREVGLKTQELSSARQKLQKQKDYEEIKRELDILKSIEFSVADDDDDDNDDNDENDNEKKKLEKMLLVRNKKLNSDLTVLRVKNTELKHELEECREQIRASQADLEATKHLNQKLEEDLTTLQNNDGGMSLVSGWGKASRVSPTQSIIGGRGSVSSATGGGSTDNSILPIITQQRDRFRARNAELEQELRKNWQLVTNLRKELETVKKDNVDLYEKTRYANAFRRGGQLEANAEERYRSVYEDTISPFQKFKGRETERALSRMGPFERVAYQFTRIILASRLSRNLFMVYCLALHILVMIVVMYGVGSAPVATEVIHHTSNTIISEAGEALGEKLVEPNV